MSPKSRKTTIIICLIIAAILLAALAINWFMTYRLEDTLRKRLRTEVIQATDGFYDFSFDKLKVGLFSGELMIEGLAFCPDTTALEAFEDSAILPNIYFDVHIDTVNFKGINLAWKFNYRKLSFQEFLLKGPSIKIISPQKEHRRISDSIVKSKSLYETISPFFDVIRADHINLKRAEVQYLVKDSTTSLYALNDFEFTARNFVLDEHSQTKEDLLYSSNFDFSTNTPQVIYDSEHLLLNINNIKLSTVDSLVQIGEVHLQSKDKYWVKRLEKPGSYNNINVGNLSLGGIALSRDGAYNFLDARTLNISKPTIEYFDVEKEEKKTISKKPLQTDSLVRSSWSLYSIISPLMDRITIEKIDVADAQLTYVQTKDEQSNKYTLNRLNFLAYKFHVDSLHRNYISYVNDFSIEASQVQGHLSSKNTVINVDLFKLSSINKELSLSKIKLNPISIVENKNYMSGEIKDLKISNIHYENGLDADLLYIDSPQLNYFKAKNSTPNKKGTTQKDNAKTANKLLDAIAPFVRYLSVKDITINNANASFIDNHDNSKYQLSNLNFYAKNFYIDENTRRIRDYLFHWDEYRLSFQNFDNFTPDKKYRIQIKKGNFSSITGNMLLVDLKVTPKDSIMGSYISLSTPYVTLLGLDEKGVRKRKISFKTFILDSPTIEVVKADDQVGKSMEQEVKSIALDLISFDLLTIPSPSIYYYDATKESSAQIQSTQMHIDSLQWKIDERFSFHNFVIESPYISIVESKENTPSKQKKQIDISSFGNIDIRKLEIKKPIIKIKKLNSFLDFSADSYLLKSLYWDQKTNSILEIEELDLKTPKLLYTEGRGEKKETTRKSFTKDEIIKTLSSYANRTKLGKINISDLNLQHIQTRTDGLEVKNKLVDTHFILEKLDSDLEKKQLSIDELAFKTKDISYPIMDSFYTLRIADIDFSKKKKTLNINNIELDPNYPKFDFAYIHPKGADWFDIKIDKINLSGIDASKLISDTLLLVEEMKVEHVMLQNLKNQKIEIEHNKMPLIYEQLQRFPLKYHIGDLDIKDFSVIYEELAKNGYQPARLPFSKMNGHIKDFTNIQSGNNTFYTLHADGLVMGTTPFTAQWKIPVDSVNDKFYLSAEIKDLDMRDFNQLISPMAPTYVKSGMIKKFNFNAEATSLGATVDMEFAYDSLYIVLLKNMNSDQENKFLTHIVNRWGIKKQNYGKNIRKPHMSIVRDPYHSNFNYFWQILQPPIIESVGISEEKQNLAHNLGHMLSRIKNIFKKKKKEEQTSQSTTLPSED